MKILGFETTTNACSVALLNDDNISEKYTCEARIHAQQILPMVDELLQQANIQLSDLDALAFGSGPGSFTGVRIAVGVVQALSLSNNTGVIAVSSLQTLAQTAYRKFAKDHIAVMQNAHMGQVYWGVYQVQAGLMQAVMNDQILQPEQVAFNDDHQYLLLGDGYQAHEAIFANKQPIMSQISKIESECYPQAQDLVRLAVQKFDPKQLLSAEKALPIYLREADAWKKTIV